jgi:putative component of toxin-antitoxin plasmid stabilization module
VSNRTKLRTSIVLLHGGDKSSQQRDIAKAQRLAREVK